MSLFIANPKITWTLNHIIKHVENVCIRIMHIWNTTSAIVIKLHVLWMASIKYLGFKFSIQYPTWTLDWLFVHYQGLQDIDVCNMNWRIR